MFHDIKLERWRQFQYLNIEFHPQLTVLTGANGTGKTTILNLLNRHFGWNLQLVSTPRRLKRGRARFFSDLWPADEVQDEEAEPAPSRSEIGQITYSDGQVARLSVPENLQEAYAVEISGQERIPGIFVPSHRPVYGVYQKVEQIPTELQPKEQLFEIYLNALRNFYTPRPRALPIFQIKQALISLATFGYGNEVVQPNQEAIDVFEGFQNVLRTVLPESLGFESFEILMPEVVLKTRSGEFSFDAVSGGVSALIDISWQLLMRSRIDERFAVIIDEPENHLHPELQRAVLPNLLKAFPDAQFIVATHNPFVVSSVPESNVYVLDYTTERKVVSTVLDMVNKAGTSNEILRDVLGLSNVMPLWVETRVEEIVRKYSAEELNEAVLRLIKADMSEIGLGDLFPEALTRVLEQGVD